MMLFNWSLHFTHPAGRAGQRVNIEMRFASQAPLDRILRKHAQAV